MLWEKRVRHNFSNKVILTFVFPIPQMNYKINLDTANPKVASLKVNKENYMKKMNVTSFHHPTPSTTHRTQTSTGLKDVECSPTLILSSVLRLGRPQ